MSFQKGDRFRAKGTDATGLIESVSFNSIQQEQEYYVRWDHFPYKVHCYMADNVDDIWEKIAAQVGQLPTGILSNGPYVATLPDSPKDGHQVEIGRWGPPEEQKRDCDKNGHDWAIYDSGFTIYDYCKVCDKKKDH